jgi:ABC-2 type transport system permease protein
VTLVRGNLDTERITDKGRGGSGMAGMIFGFIIAFFLYMTIFLYGQTVLRGVLEEKTTRVAEVIVASVRPEILLAGKVIGVGAVGLTQLGIWMASGSVMWGLRMRFLGAIAGPGYTFYACLFAAVGAMVSSQEEANQAMQPVAMLLISAIIFVQPVATNPTGRLAQIMSWLPFSAPIIMPLRMTATPLSTIEVAGSLLGVLAACFAAVWVAARIYRVGLLMYGKRPSIRELVRWVRQS